MTSVVARVRSIPVIAFLGGIGSGKSAVVNEFARRSNAIVINADQVGHEVLKIPKVIHQITDVFGTEVLNSQQQIDRKSLASKVFGDSAEQKAAREQLEHIVHPEIRNQIEQTIKNSRQANEIDFILLDAAVLLEARWDSACDLIVFVDVPEHLRLQRVQEGRNWSAEEFHRREASQFDLPQKKAKSHIQIQNDSTVKQAVDQLEQQLDKFLNLP